MPGAPSRPGEFHPEPLTDPDLTPLPVDPISKAMARPLRSTGITPLRRYYGAIRPSPAHRYFRPRGWNRLCLSLAIAGQVLTFRTEVWSSFAPSTCRMPLGRYQDILRADPGGWVSPRFRHRLSRFRRFRSGSLALASLDHACPDHRPGVSATLTTTALTAPARGGLGSAT